MATVAIPIETKVRELDGKSWLSLNLVNNGHRVIIGPSNEIASTLDITEPDIYITKDPGDSNVDFINRLQSGGITVCGLDTEGAVFGTMKEYTRNRKQILNHLDAFFVWGNQQAKAIQHHYEEPREDLHVTGNPRFDLLQPNYRSYYNELAASHRSKYGKFVLVNGNFSIANPYQKKVISEIERINGDIESQKLSYHLRIFHLFLDAIYHIASEIDDITVIMRPHPSEDNTTYEREFDHHDNIVVEDSGDVRTWIAGSQTVIHHDCTTGIESALMGVPTLSYRPIQKEEYEAEIPISVSAEAQTTKEVVDYVTKSITSDDPYKLTEDQMNRLKQYFHNVDQVAAENICDVINNFEPRSDKLGDPVRPGAFGRLERRVKSSQWESQVITIYDAIQRLIGDSSPQEQRQYRDQKFSGLKKEELEENIVRLERFLELDDLTIEKISLTDDTYSIY